MTKSVARHKLRKSGIKQSTSNQDNAHWGFANDTAPGERFKACREIVEIELLQWGKLSNLNVVPRRFECDEEAIDRLEKCGIVCSEAGGINQLGVAMCVR